MAIQPIVVVRKKKRSHAGPHGGAWKVAYADFVTAMMAFFLVMWLVGQSKEVKASVAGYFRDPGAFDAQHASGILPGGTQLAPSATERPATAAQTKAAAEAERRALEASVRHIRERLDSVPEFKTLRDQIEFTITAEGLRIDLIESSGSSFFDTGSAHMRPEAERIFAVIARELGTLDNLIVVEGHTDSRQYTNLEGYTNWELSADRANAARRVMERGGLRSSQVLEVRSQADRQLKIASDPLDPRNRRVSVLVKSHGR
jgi:chemotaxis protein MotB